MHLIIYHVVCYPLNYVIITTTDLNNTGVDKRGYHPLFLGCTVVAHNDGPFQLPKSLHHHYRGTYVKHFLNYQQSRKKNVYNINI